MEDVKDPREFFSQHHQAYGTSPRHARGQDLNILLSGLAGQKGERALDVATGGGHTAIKLAEQGVEVTVVDITVEMLDDTLKRASERNLEVTAVTAYAEQLPFSERAFDIVTCRRAAHHFRDVSQFVRESHRVLKPGGRLGISDMTGSASGVDWLNRLERLRDPSHNRAMASDAWYGELVSAGFGQIEVRLLEEPMSFTEWLSPVVPESADGARAMQFLSESDAPLEFVRGDRFIKRRIILWGVR